MQRWNALLIGDDGGLLFGPACNLDKVGHPAHYERAILVREKECERYKDLLRIIAYPRRGTSEEADYVYAEDCAKLIQANFSLEDLLPRASA